MSDSTATINQQACAWIAKLHGEPSEQDLQRFRDWMAQSSAHKTEVRQLAKLWGELDVLTELAVVNDPVAKTASKANRLFKLPDWSVGFRAAAALLIVVVLTVPFILGIDKTNYSTKVGEQQLVTLEDGSTVLLNTNSQIRVDYTGEVRNISLVKGQAHFDVMPNRQRPFNVYAGKGLVRAVGTAFSVYLQPQTVEITVTEGTVELSALEAPGLIDSAEKSPAQQSKITKLSLIDAGQNATFDQIDSSLDKLETIEAAAIVQKLAWHQGLLRFSGDPLKDVVAEVSRYTDIKIVVLDPEIRDLRIGGFFKVGETEKMFQALESSFGVKVKRMNKKTVHLIADNSSTYNQTEK